jgi:hypothetical protein
MKSFYLMVTVLVMVLVAPASTSLAVPPDGEMCGQVMTAMGEMETSIQSCMNELLDEQLKMLDGLEEVGEEMRLINMTLLGARGISTFQRSVLLNFMASSQGGGDNLQLMRDQVQRAMQENAAVEDADHDDAFARAGQQKGKSCKFSDMPFVESLDGEYPPGLKPFSGSTFDPKFGDGKCNLFKARLDNPGEPNDDEVVRINERSDNMCERVCADREGDGDLAGFNASPPKRKDERKDRTVSALTDNLAAARRVNENMETAAARISALRFELSSEVYRASRVHRSSSDVYRFDGEADEADSCEPLDVARGLDEAAEVTGLIKNGVAIVTASLELAKETARPPSKQDAAGFNASTAETPFSVATGISKIVEQSFGFIESGLKVSALIAAHIQDFAQAECLASVQVGVMDLKDIGNDTNDAIAALDTKVDDLKARMVEVIQMLNTPAGRRAGFPAN